MKRRDFLKTTVVLTTPSLSSHSRLYGTPASLTHGMMSDNEKFSLPLADLGFPAEEIPIASRICGLWEDVLTNDECAQRFIASPKQYLKSACITPEEKLLADEGMKLLQTLASKPFRKALSNADYKEAYSELAIAAGDFSSGKLSRNIAEVLDQHAVAIRQYLDSQDSELRESLKRLSDHLDEHTGGSKEIDLAIVAETMKIASSDSDVVIQCASCVVAVAIAATVTLYVSVVVAVTVAVLAGVWVSAGVSMAISAHGQERPMPPHLASFAGKYLRLDKDAYRTALRQVRWAKATGDAKFELHVVKATLRKEIEATVAALDFAGIVPIGKAHVAGVVDALTAYVSGAAGLPNDDA